MLIDQAEVTLSGGHGGRGIVSFGKMAHSGPDGGNGGKGGDLYLVSKPDLTLLNQFSREKIFSAPDGEPGGKNKRTGKNGGDIEIYIPIGTVVKNRLTGKTLYEFEEVEQKELICKGGAGGRGNFEFRSSTNTTPMQSERGKPGEKIEVILDLKLIAEYGLVGLPNAGKSSLLNEITRANVKTANYPFTTLEPNLGVYKGKIIADVPGLIEGASKGKGLGISFLKHIEKVKVILHCIASDSGDPINDYKTIRDEMLEYNKNLGDKREIVLLTKSDLMENKEINKVIRKLKKLNNEILPVSIHNWESIEDLKKILN